jgi:hypothetical protein
MDKNLVDQISNTQALVENLICLRKAVLLTVWVSAVVLLVAERDHKESREEEVI